MDGSTTNNKSGRGIADLVQAQKEAFEEGYGRGLEKWYFHDTPNPVVRYLRDRRLRLALKSLQRLVPQPFCELSALTVCGGVGGEATYLRKAGFSQVTNADLSANALEICRLRDPSLKTLRLNAEDMDLADQSFDVVVVQDGLHHLPRPVLGFNEMLRVARRAVVVIEPHAGLVGKLIGHEWEEQEGAINFVFRWDRNLLIQATRSQLLQRPAAIEVLRQWDHSGCVHKLVAWFGNGRWSLAAAKVTYAALTPLGAFGNSFIGIVAKCGDDTAPR